MPFRTLMVTDYEHENFAWTTKAKENEICFIISDADKVVYVWNGQKASMVRKYKGGTLATKIKSLYQLYGFKTQTVNQGEEVGALKAEVELLLAGNGTPFVEEEGVAPPKVAPSIAERVSRPEPSPAREAARVVDVPVKKVEPTPVAAPVVDKRIGELEAELESEKKKSQHKLTKLKEEMDAAKETSDKKISNLEKQIADLNSEVAIARKSSIDVDKFNSEIKQLKGEKESLNVLVEGLKKELEQKEDAAKTGEDAAKKIAALQTELDGLKDVKTKLADAETAKTNAEKKSAELANKAFTLETEVSTLKSKLASAGEQKAAAGDLDALKKQVETLQKDIESANKKLKDAEAKLAESDNKIKQLENKAASAKEESHAAQRKLIEQKEEAKQKVVSKEMDGLDFASLDEVSDTKHAGGAGLAFVNPYTDGELGGEIDPLTDLRSFLNTVDPSKPLDPELKSLLDIISKKVESDPEIVNDLQKIKKKIKDKKLDALIDDAIKKIKAMSS